MWLLAEKNMIEEGMHLMGHFEVNHGQVFSYISWVYVALDIYAYTEKGLK